MASFGGAGFIAITTLVLLSMVAGSQAKLKDQYTAWTPTRCNYSDDGRSVDLTMKDPKQPYASMTSKLAYLYGSIGVWIKLTPGDSAGTVTTFYLSSTGENHCEFDYEFLGNSSGQPYLLHTNIFVDGVGGREQQIRLWFDPTVEYHYYHFHWNKDLVMFYIDNTPIRVFHNLESKIVGFKYPKNCPMAMYLSMWDGSGWATQGGRVKLNWASAPFTASYTNFKTKGSCVAKQGDLASIHQCQNSPAAAPGTKYQRFGGTRTKKLRWVKQNHVHYNYCDDARRYPVRPAECSHNLL